MRVGQVVNRINKGAWDVLTSGNGDRRGERWLRGGAAETQGAGSGDPVSEHPCPTNGRRSLPPGSPPEKIAELVGFNDACRLSRDFKPLKQSLKESVRLLKSLAHLQVTPYERWQFRKRICSETSQLRMIRSSHALWLRHARGEELSPGRHDVLPIVRSTYGSRVRATCGY